MLNELSITFPTKKKIPKTYDDVIVIQNNVIYQMGVKFKITTNYFYQDNLQTNQCIYNLNTVCNKKN